VISRRSVCISGKISSPRALKILSRTSRRNSCNMTAAKSCSNLPKVHDSNAGVLTRGLAGIFLCGRHRPPHGRDSPLSTVNTIFVKQALVSVSMFRNTPLRSEPRSSHVSRFCVELWTVRETPAGAACCANVDGPSAIRTSGVNKFRLRPQGSNLHAPS
jgi:hypothetical protein